MKTFFWWSSAFLVSRANGNKSIRSQSEETVTKPTPTNLFRCLSPVAEIAHMIIFLNESAQHVKNAGSAIMLWEHAMALPISD